MSENTSITKEDVAVLGCIVEPMATERSTAHFKRVVGYIVELNKSMDISRFPLLPTAETGMDVDREKETITRGRKGEILLLNTFEVCYLIAQEPFNGEFKGTPSRLGMWESLITNGIFRHETEGAGIVLRLAAKSKTVKDEKDYSASLVAEFTNGHRPRLAKHFVSCAENTKYNTYVVRDGFEDFEVFVPGNKIREKARAEQKRLKKQAEIVGRELAEASEKKLAEEKLENKVEEKLAETLPDELIHDTEIIKDLENIEQGTTSDEIILESVIEEVPEVAEEVPETKEVTNEVTEEVLKTKEVTNEVSEEVTKGLAEEVPSETFDSESLNEQTIKNTIKSRYKMLRAGRNFYSRGGVLLRVDASQDLKDVYLTCEMCIDKDKWLILSTNNLDAETMEELEISEFVLNTSAIRRDSIHRFLSPSWDSLSYNDTGVFDEYNKLLCYPDTTPYLEFRSHLLDSIKVAILKFMPLGIY